MDKDDLEYIDRHIDRIKIHLLELERLLVSNMSREELEERYIKCLDFIIFDPCLICDFCSND